MVTQPTRISEGAQNIHDLVLTSHPHIVDHCKVVAGLGDHEIPTFSLKFKPKRNTKQPRKIYLFISKGDSASFQSDLLAGLELDRGHRGHCLPLSGFGLDALRPLSNLRTFLTTSWPSFYNRLYWTPAVVQTACTRQWGMLFLTGYLFLDIAWESFIQEIHLQCTLKFLKHSLPTLLLEFMVHSRFIMYYLCV